MVGRTQEQNISRHASALYRLSGSPETFIKRLTRRDAGNASKSPQSAGSASPEAGQSNNDFDTHWDAKEIFHLFPDSFSIDEAISSDDRGSSVKNAYLRIANPLGFNAIPFDFSPDLAFEALNREFPWFEAANVLVVSWFAACKKSRRFRLPNILMDGPPGIGKTRWARRIASMSQTVCTHPDDAVGVIPLSGVDQTLNIIGCDQSYIGSRPGLWFEVMARSQSANPILVLDEIDKAELNVANALLAYLAPETSARFFCPFFRTEVNLSQINYIGTTNYSRDLPEPFLSRMEVMECHLPTPEDIEQIIPSIASEIIQDLDIADTMFSPDISAVLRTYQEKESIRAVRRELERQIRDTVWTPQANTLRGPSSHKRSMGFRL